jgi:hypothetical protein
MGEIEEQTVGEGAGDGKRAQHAAPLQRQAGLVLVMAAALLLWLWIAIPLALGHRTLYFRDVFTTHLPLKAFGAAELREGRIPVFNPTWGLGQPFRGNPNVLPFYPGNLLYLVLPFWSAFNLHYALHWLLAALAMYALARGMGQGPAGALVAGITYAGSGWILTGLSFYNLLAVSAWWPLVMLGAARADRRGMALGGIACGLALLAGEPVTTVLGLVPLLLVALQRHGLRRGLLRVLGIGAIGLVMALPQIVATARILGFTSRGALGAAGIGAGRFHLGPARLLELIVPYPFGLPWDLGKAGYWPWDDQPGLPYILTLHIGIVGLWLALLGVRRARGWAGLALAGIVLAWAGALGGDALVVLSRGLVRYPEKLLFWFALAAALLVGWGLERALESARAWKTAYLATGIMVLLSLAVFAAGSRLAGWLAEGRVDPDYFSEAPKAHVEIWSSGLLVAWNLLGVAAIAARRRSGAGLAAAQLLSLVFLGGLVMTAPVADFGPSPWMRTVPAGSRVVPAGPSGPLSDPSYLTLMRISAANLGPAPGVLQGLSYPLAPDLDGLYSPLSALVLMHQPDLDANGRANWMRTLGVDWVVLDGRLHHVPNPAPAAWWPRSASAASSPAEAFRFVSLSPDPVADVIADRQVPHQPGATVRLLSETPDEIEIEVMGGGGLLVLRRAFQPLYQASAEGKTLPTLAVNLSLLGVQVPPGAHRVRIAARAW